MCSYTGIWLIPLINLNNLINLLDNCFYKPLVSLALF